ncbi:maleylpyruvate isomerase family mycothiol-dependent enzyme [Phytohabitans rumicis]|uniref:Mycothiol-dependent maleylpyruvate isomerase metal-binding domain-containing protein n=1 Tax=Phytohabitans rumicis TaxID=1076125 RepID=A0A6V8L5N9_9ACTN|nr:maleylpyruvate isomerase family mycothiol-dependent enzyme [Phytohabitans rumicis]GFJ90328.1 hypothetical protein Prum_039700 [Phytohabitans rumicis]
MDQDQVWTTIDDHRARLTDLLADLSEDEWRRPSLCDGWTIRDVAAHLAWQPTITMPAALPAAMLGLIRARGSMHRAIHDEAVRYARRPTEQIIAEVRGTIGARRPVPGMTYLETLIDVLVHGQDIAVPLGRRLDMAPEAAAVAVARIWTKPSLFRSTKHLHAFRFTATDTAWSAGDGPEVRGPIGAILLRLTGRPADLPQAMRGR